MHSVSTVPSEKGIRGPALPLVRLGLAKSTISHLGCAGLPALGQTLTTLDLSFNPKVRHGAFLAHLPRLTELDVSLNAWVDDEAVHCLACANLKRLTLEKTSVTDGGIAALSASALSLQHLDLSRTAVRGTEASFAALAQMGCLRSLFLAFTEVDGRLAAHLPPRLEWLKLSRAVNFDDAALKSLAMRASSLTSLDVGSYGITDASIGALQDLAAKGLTSLTLWHTNVSLRAANALVDTQAFELDQSMGTSQGTYLMKRVDPPRVSAAEEMEIS